MSESDSEYFRNHAPRVARLEALVEKLQATLERTQQPGKRQADPFRKNKQAAPPQNPERKPGDEHGDHTHREIPKPEESDERHDVPLPAASPCESPSDRTQHSAAVSDRDSAAVANRQVWGGNRTWDGASLESMLMSVLITYGQQGIDSLEFLANNLKSKTPIIIPAMQRSTSTLNVGSSWD